MSVWQRYILVVGVDDEAAEEAALVVAVGSWDAAVAAERGEAAHELEAAVPRRLPPVGLHVHLVLLLVLLPRRRPLGPPPCHRHGRTPWLLPLPHVQCGGRRGHGLRGQWQRKGGGGAWIWKLSWVRMVGKKKKVELDAGGKRSYLLYFILVMVKRGTGPPATENTATLRSARRT